MLSGSDYGESRLEKGGFLHNLKKAPEGAFFVNIFFVLYNKKSNKAVLNHIPKSQ